MNSILEVSNLKKSYNNNLILSNVSFHIAQGEIVGLIGRNGAGKTTLMKAILGLIRTDEGEIAYDGNKDYKSNKHLMNSIGYLLDCRFFEYLNAYDNLKIQEMYYGSKLNKVELDKRIIETLNFVELKNDKKKVKDYSFGMKQRLGLALALFHDTKLLILDKPFVGLDPIGIEKFKSFINRISEEKRVSILISSHQLSEIEDMCKRYLIISEKTLANYEDEEVKFFTIVIDNLNDEFIVQLKNLDPDLKINQNAVSFSYDQEKLNIIISAIFKHNLVIQDISVEKNKLSDLFINMK